MVVQRAVFEKRTAPLSYSFGLKVVREKFGDQFFMENWPKYSKGPRKGKFKGFICWTKCSVGGWARSHPSEPGLSGVVKPGSSDWRVAMIEPEADPHGHSIVARWTYVKNSDPIIELLQSPQEALERHKIHGSNARYG